MTELAEGQLAARAARIATVVTKHGLRDRLEHGEGRAKRLRAALEELGPTFAKLGQILSTRPDLLPPEVVEELSALQDRVPPLTEAAVVAVMEQELGVPWEDVFESIDPEPLAAGTIAEVHRAKLESGERVVVKVQRPNARDEIMRDLGLLELFAEKAEGREALRELVDIPAVVEHLSSSLRRELDFCHEAENIERMRAVLAPYARLDVPRVYERLTTPRLLVMEEVQGVPVRKAPQGEARKEAARQLLEAYYRQILKEGFFHADPHPGNLLWWNDRIYFLDLGMVGEVDAEARGLLLLVLLAFWRKDAPFLADLAVMLSGDEPARDLDLGRMQEDFAAFIARFHGGALKDIQFGPMLEEMIEISAHHGIPLPASLALTGKAFGQMQLVVAELDPTLDPFSVIGSFVLHGVGERVREHADPQRLFYEGQKLRLRAERFVEAIERATGARPGSRLQVEVRGSTPLEEAIRRAGRRIALAFAGGATLLAAVLAAAASKLDSWVPIVLGVGAGIAAAALAVDLLRQR